MNDVAMPLAKRSTSFLWKIVQADVDAGKNDGNVVTRFPPNGHIHIGLGKVMYIDFMTAQEFGGRCHIRIDDTNPERIEDVQSLVDDTRWLGFESDSPVTYASSYFDRYYELGEQLIRMERAYVCDLSSEEFARDWRGSVNAPGKESPYRARSVEENLDLFRRMRAGEFKDGEKVVRARIDMAARNMKMRDPPIFRIRHTPHSCTGSTWFVYPLYDFAAVLADSFEGVTHSLCTAEFVDRRELYDWVIAVTGVPHAPRQVEFGALNLTYTVVRSRVLRELVEGKHVTGWDDPRLPTLSGMRRRGFTPEALREFYARIGIAKRDTVVDVGLLEQIVRDDLERRAPRAMGVLDPVEMVIESYPENEVETFTAHAWPDGMDPFDGAPRETFARPFSRVVYIERADIEQPGKPFGRVTPGAVLRLRNAYVVTCTAVERDERGEVVRVHATHDPASLGASKQKVSGAIHWVSAAHAKDVEVRLYDRLFTAETPGADGRSPIDDLNPVSLRVVRAKVEPRVAAAAAGDRFQFERLGFVIADPESRPGEPVFNLTIDLKNARERLMRDPSRTESK